MLEFPVLVDPWQPAPELLHEATMAEKLKLMERAVDYACSDTQFATKLKQTLAYIMTSGTEEEGVVVPISGTTHAHIHTHD